MTGVAQERLERLLRLVLGQRLASRTTFIRFALVGGTGYVVYQSVLFLMYDSPLIWFLPAKNTSADILVFAHGDLRFLITTLAATSLALVGVFTGHNLWTFGAKLSDRKPLWLRFGQFAAFASVAAFGIVLPTVNVLTVQFDLHHFLALPVGVALGGVWDWLWYSRFVWRGSRAEQADAHGG